MSYVSICKFNLLTEKGFCLGTYVSKWGDPSKIQTMPSNNTPWGKPPRPSRSIARSEDQATVSSAIEPGYVDTPPNKPQDTCNTCGQWGEQCELGFDRTRHWENWNTLEGSWRGMF